MATPGRAIKSFGMTDPWPFKQNPGVQSQSWSLWNTLPGTGATRAFYAEWGSTSEADIAFPETESELLKILPVSHPCHTVQAMWEICRNGKTFF